MTATWRRAGRLAPAWWKVPAAIWSKTAWNRPACAGRRMAHKRSWICGPCASTAIGMRIGSFIDSNNITDCMVPHRQRQYRKPRYYRWQLDAAHRLWSHSFHLPGATDEQQTRPHRPAHPKHGKQGHHGDKEQDMK